MGLWGSLAILSGLGPDDPGSKQIYFANFRAAPHFNGGITVVSTKLGSVRRFGSRYGRTVRHKVAKFENTQRSKHLCPYCRKEKAKRLSVGIWQCQSCNAKFTSKAYTVDLVKKTKPIVNENETEVKIKSKSSGSKYSDKFVHQENEVNEQLEESEKQD
jgi:large subunit ribosomal protein L37Ae